MRSIAWAIVVAGALIAFGISARYDLLGGIGLGPRGLGGRSIMVPWAPLFLAAVALYGLVMLTLEARRDTATRGFEVISRRPADD